MKRLIVFALVGAAIIGVVVWRNAPRRDASHQASLNEGLQYLAGAYEPYHFKDPYLEYVYPAESIECPIEGCRLTYRTLDGFFDVVFIEKEFADSTIIQAIRQDAHRAFDAILPLWRTANISNAIRSTSNEGVALDTACILAYSTLDEALASHIASFLTDDGNWLRDDLYMVDSWRNIADESWCSRMLIATSVAGEQHRGLISKSIREADTYLSQPHSLEERLAVLFHLVYLLHDADDLVYKPDLARYADQLAEIGRQILNTPNTFSQANILDALSYIQYKDAQLMQSLADRILSAQKPDGSWSSTAGDQTYPVFSTMRVLLALNKYERNLINP